MVRHFYQVGDETSNDFMDAIKAQSRIEALTSNRPQIMEHFEDGDVVPHPHGFEAPRNFIGTKADEAQRMLDEAWNQ